MVLGPARAFQLHCGEKTEALLHHSLLFRGSLNTSAWFQRVGMLPKFREMELWYSHGSPAAC